MRFSLLLGLAALGGQLGVYARALPDQKNEIEDISLDKRAGGGGGPVIVRPPPVRPPPGGGVKPGSGISISPRISKLSTTWEARAAREGADLIQSTGCNAKRDIALEAGLTKRFAKRATGDLNYAEWQRVFAAVERAIDPAFQGTITIYFAGGISAISMGVRDTAADADYMMEGDTYPDNEKSMVLKEAISKALDDPQIADLRDRLDPDFMNDDMGTLIEGPGRVYVQSNSHEDAYTGTKLVAKHMVYDMQTFMKLVVISEKGTRPQGYDMKDVSDARAFLPKALEANGGPFTTAELKLLGDRIGITEDESQKAFSFSVRKIDSQMANFDQGVKDWVAAAGC